MSGASKSGMAAAAVLLGAATFVHAQTAPVDPAAIPPAYPVKAIRVICGFPPSSGADITARVIAARLSTALGQQVVVDNRPGAGSNIAAEVAARSPADGYSLFIATVANAINASLHARLPFDFVRDFTPIALATAVPNVLAVHPSVPAKSVKDLIALAKKRPGELTYASSGVGTSTHLAAELFNVMAGVRTSHVPYKGSPPAVIDLLAGEVTMMFSPASTVLPHVKAGRLRALAVTTTKRLASLPESPTVAEAGLTGYEVLTWFGFVAPARTPQAVVARLNAEIVKVLAQPDVREQFAVQGMEALGGTPEHFADYIRDDVARWAKVIKASGAKAE